MKRIALGALVAIGAAAGCAKTEQPVPGPPPSTAMAPLPRQTPGTAAPKPGESETECVDKWLAAHGLDRYGHPSGSMYAGGTPLFNEATGQTRDRLEYVYERQPDARAACRAGG
jgi:hypothetical protein